MKKICRKKGNARKLVLLFAVFAGSTLVAQASDYAYLTFETVDGVKASVSSSSLDIVISGTTLTAGTQSFTLSNLSKMYFTSSDMTTGIKAVAVTELDDASEIYDLNGRKVSKEQLVNGVYVVKSKSGNYKIAVR